MLKKLPKNILYVKDFTYALPDDFNGNLEDALKHFINYRNKHKEERKVVDKGDAFSSLEIVFASEEEKKGMRSIWTVYINRQSHI